MSEKKHGRPEETKKMLQKFQGWLTETVCINFEMRKLGWTTTNKKQEHKGRNENDIYDSAHFYAPTKIKGKNLKTKTKTIPEFRKLTKSAN